MRSSDNKYLALSLLILLAGCQTDLVDYDRYETKSSASMRLKFSANTEQEIESTLSGFAAAYGYDMAARRVRPSEPRFILAMWRPDSLILMRNPFEVNLYRVSIYAARKDPSAIATMNNLLAEIEAEVMGQMLPDKALQQSGTD